MSVFLQILQCILCCEEDRHDDKYDNTSYRSPLHISHSYDTSASRSSAPSYSNLPYQSPNLYIRNLTSSYKTSLSSPNPTTYSTSSPSFSKPLSSSSSPSLSSTKAPPSSSKPSLLSPNPATYFTSSPSFSKPLSSSSSPSPSSTKALPSSSNLSQKSPPTPAASSYKLPPLSKPATSSKPPPLSPHSPSSSCKPSPSSSGPNPLPSFKTTLSPAFSDSDVQQKIWLEKGISPTYKIPKDIEDLIKKDIVPGVLKMPLSPSTFKDYFAALLYAEDFYVE